MVSVDLVPWSWPLSVCHRTPSRVGLSPPTATAHRGTEKMGGEWGAWDPWVQPAGPCGFHCAKQQEEGPVPGSAPASGTGVSELSRSAASFKSGEPQRGPPGCCTSRLPLEALDTYKVPYLPFQVAWVQRGDFTSRTVIRGFMVCCVLFCSLGTETAFLIIFATCVRPLCVRCRALVAWFCLMLLRSYEFDIVLCKK